MSEPRWFKQYFSASDFSNLNPTILYEGKKYAVVRIQQEKKVAFLGVWKGGKHNLTTAEALLEGGADVKQLQKMRDWLTKKEG